MICASCLLSLNNAATLKKVALLAEVFFKKRVEEYELKHSVPDADFENLIEYVEEAGEEFIDDEDLLELEIESTPHETTHPAEASVYNKDYRCECGIAFESNHLLQSHMRMKHKLVTMTDVLPCQACDKK